MSSALSWIIVGAALAAIWASAWVDFRTFRIPNFLVLLTTGLGLLAQTAGSGTSGLLDGFLGLGLALLLFLPLYVFGLIGAGDVKLMAAASTLLGPSGLPWGVFWTLVITGLMGIGYAVNAWRSEGARGPWGRYWRMLKYLLLTGRPSYVPPPPDEAVARRLPVAVPIAIGITGTVLWLQ